MHKEKGGKLFANAPWDFDGSIGTNRGTAYDQSPEGIYVGGSALTNSSISASELYISLMKVDDFKNRVGIRWNELSGDIEALVNEIMAESYILETKEALGKNFFFWSENRNIETDPAEGRNAYAIYNSLEDATNGYVRSSNEVKKWILDRINWLNGYFK